MKILSSAILAILFTAAVLGQNSADVDTTTEGPTTTSKSTTSAPTTTSVHTTPAQTTTTSTPETTTPEPPTTTVSSTSSSTLAPTTTVSSTSSSTLTPTTVVPSTSAAPPTKPPSIDECSWNVTQDNVTCIRVELKALFIIPIEGKMEYIVITQNATDNLSNCSLSNDTQKFVLKERNYTLTMIFAKEVGKVFVNETTLEYSLSEGTGSVSSDARIFTVKAGNSYMCKSLVDLKLGNVTMEIQDMHIQAFGVQGSSDYGAVEECEADDKVSDAVPIAVGCALAALIIIVLIAYLVGRRQSRQKGYQSV